MSLSRTPDTRRKLVARHEDGAGRAELWTRRVRGREELEMVVNGVFLMASYNRLSSEVLLRAPLGELRDRESLRVLIGGLGMGYSAAEACRTPNVVRIDVVELNPAIARWNETHLAARAGSPLGDPRVHVAVKDFRMFVDNVQEPYDVVAMDIDNGPALLVRPDNARVYRRRFFESVRRILAPGGRFSVWACREEPRIRSAGECVFGPGNVLPVVEQHEGRDVDYFVYLWRKKGTGK